MSPNAMEENKVNTMQYDITSNTTIWSIGDTFNDDEGNIDRRVDTRDKGAEEGPATIKEIICFGLGSTGYRTIKLSVELFLVLRVQSLAFPVTYAGLIFLIYSIASMIAAGLIFMVYPTVSFGSATRSRIHFFASVGFSTGGFFGPAEIGRAHV